MSSRNANRQRHKDSPPRGGVVGLLDTLRENGTLPEKTGKSTFGGKIVDTPLSVETLRTTQICWAIPFDEICYSKWVRAWMVHNRVMPWDDFNASGSTYLPDARNILHTAFVTKFETEWMFMLDSDVSAPPRTVEQFLARIKANPDIKIIGGWYRKKAEPFEPVVYEDMGDTPDGKIGGRIYEEEEIGKGLEKVDLAGAGCWFMHRSVAEAIGEEPYDLNSGGEDLLLCRKVREAGFDIYLDWDIACAHIGVGIA